MRQLPELIIFDLDGTLIEFHHEYLFSQTREVLEKLNHPIVPLDILSKFFSTFDYFGFVDRGNRDPFINSFWENFNWNGFPPPKPLVGVLDTLKTFHKEGVKLAITTSRFMPLDVLEKELEPTGIIEVMHYVTARSGDHIHWTDKTGLITEACSALGVSPKETMMVGDIPTDIKSAKDVGVKTSIAVTSGGIHHEILAKEEPTAILPDVSHLLDFLRSAD